jgi:hypothetical protein
MCVIWSGRRCGDRVGYEHDDVGAAESSMRLSAAALYDNAVL